MREYFRKLPNPTEGGAVVQLVLYRIGDRAYTAQGRILHETERVLLFETSIDRRIRVESINVGETLAQYFDQGNPARVRAFDGDGMLAEDGFLLRPTDDTLLIVER